MWINSIFCKKKKKKEKKTCWRLLRKRSKPQKLIYLVKRKNKPPYSIKPEICKCQPVSRCKREKIHNYRRQWHVYTEDFMLSVWPEKKKSGISGIVLKKAVTYNCKYTLIKTSENPHVLINVFLKRKLHKIHEK
jgi:hypothetical protein